MKYLIDIRMMACEVKDTYREAEIFCGERGIGGENIYEMDED